MNLNMRATVIILLFFGILLVVIGLFLALLWPSIFKIFLAKELILSTTAKSFEEWKKPTVPLYFDVYFWNWTNSEEIENLEVKPNFVELGPYRFKEIRDKQEIKFNRDATVTYKPISYYYFDAEGSNGTLDDIIVNINIVAIGAVGQSANMDYRKKKIVSWAINSYKENVTIAISARELLFEGYENDMVTAGKMGIVEGFDPSAIPFDRIGWFYKRNASTEITGTYTMNTGEDDISKLGTINKFNGEFSHSVYTGECSKLKGSIGEIFNPDLSQDSISLFMGDMCRTIPFDFEKEVEIHGITGNKYVAGDRAVDNGTKYSENSCYSGNGDDFPSGVMNISACRYSSPIFMSYPHFHNADPYYIENIEGMHPSVEKHQSYFTLEPLTGAPLEVVIRFQANFLLREDEDIALFQHMPTVFIPAMWFEQKFTMNEEMTEQIKFALQVPVIGRMVGIQVFCFGAILVIISSIIKCITNRRFSDKATEVTLETTVGSRRQFETGSPLLTQGTTKIAVQKMDIATN